MSKYEPMLISDGDLPDGDDWIYQIKWDGVRCIMEIHNGTTRLFNRAGHEITSGFPDIVRQSVDVKDGIYDGEIIAIAHSNVSFQAILQRAGVGARVTSEKMAIKYPARFMCFDILETQGVSVISLPLRERLNLIPFKNSINIPLKDSAVNFVKKNGLEGVVAKRLDATYKPGIRSEDCIRWKQISTSDLVVYGWEYGPNNPNGVRSFLLATQEGFSWRYVGKVGSGFSNEVMSEVMEAFIPLESNPCVDNEPEMQYTVNYVQPNVIFEIAHLGYEDSGLLRNPSFIQRRQDKELIPLGK